MDRRLILASASTARVAVLLAAGIEPVVAPSRVDEAAISAALGPLAAPELARQLAMRKASEVAARFELRPTDVVLGADSLFEVGNRVLGKARDRAEVVARWRAMRGGAGTLHSGHAVIAAGRMVSASASTRVEFADINDDEVAAYANTDEPLAAAGSFTLEGRAAAFIERIDGDPSNVIGLSMPLLRRLLAHLGVEITQLWIQCDGADGLA